MQYINLLIILITSFTLTFLLIKYKDKVNLNAVLNHRTMHKTITPNSGGIAIFLSFLLGIYLLKVDIDIAVLLSMMVIFIAGIYDDYFKATTKQKIFFLFVIGNILFFNNFYVNYLGTFLGNEIKISGFIAYLFLMFAIIGFVNSVNLIDGLDGLASTIGIIVLASFLYIGIKWSDEFLIYIPSIYIMSILGFLYFNFSNAKIFMGDNGSLSLGLIIAIVAIYAVNKHYITPSSVIILAGIPVLDTFVVITRRVISGQHPFVADKLHIHHIILRQQKNNTKRTVFIIGLIQVIFTYIGLGFKTRDDSVILILFFMIFILFYYLLLPKKDKIY